MGNRGPAPGQRAYLEISRSERVKEAEARPENEYSDTGAKEREDLNYGNRGAVEFPGIWDEGALFHAQDWTTEGGKGEV